MAAKNMYWVFGPSGAGKSLVPDLDTLVRQRLKRQDPAEKVATCAADIASALALANEFEAVTFYEVTEIIDFIS